MPRDPGNMFVAGDGTLYIGPTSAAAPTAFDSEPDAGFADMGGFAKENVGLTPSFTTTDLFMFGELFPVRTIITGQGIEFTITLLEATDDALIAAFAGGDVDGNGTFTPPEPQDIEEVSIILDVFDGAKAERWYMPRCQITDVGQITMANDAAEPFPLTYKMLRPSGGVKPFYRFRGVTGS